MSEWIPKTGDFADAWRSRTDGEHSWASAEESRESDAQFDRWLASVKADAWAECAKEILQTREWHGGNQKYFPRNPYRGEQA
jgi:hypothetical protein